MKSFFGMYGANSVFGNKGIIPGMELMFYLSEEVVDDPEMPASVRYRRIHNTMFHVREWYTFRTLELPVESMHHGGFIDLRAI